jgi:hypothetical protein
MRYVMSLKLHSAKEEGREGPSNGLNSVPPTEIQISKKIK